MPAIMPRLITGITLEMMEGILDRLRGRFEDLSVDLFPERPDQYRLTHPKGALLLSYVSSRYDDTRDTTIITQPRRAMFNVVSMVRQLNHGDGVVVVLDRLRLALQGYTPPHATRGLVMHSERFLSQVGGIWQYLTEFSAQTHAVQESPEEDAP